MDKRWSNLCQAGYASLLCLEQTILNSRVLESTRRAVVRFVKRVGLKRLTTKCRYPFTRKPNEMRMGKGRGEVDHEVVVVSRGRRVFELCLRNRIIEKAVLKKLAGKLGFRKRCLLN